MMVQAIASWFDLEAATVEGIIRRVAKRERVV
jgi:hypothetical protein